jgi:hypothetical protein
VPLAHIAASIYEGLLGAPLQRPAPLMPGSISSQAAIGLALSVGEGFKQSEPALDPASRGAGAELWIGEAGILVALTTIVAAIIFSRGRWTIRRVPEAREVSVQAGPLRPQT